MSFTRQLPIARADSDPQPGADITLSMSFASDEPYERWWGVEILECAPECVRLGRINDAGPLLYNHDWDQIRGHHVPGSVRADGRTVRGEVVVSHAADDGRTIALIRGGHLSKSSTSYEIHAIVEQSTHKDGSKRERTLDARLFERILTRQEQTARGDLEAFRRSLDAAAGPFERAADEPTIYRVTDWEILENSLVTVPADHTVGVGRSHARDTQYHQPAAPAIHHPQGASPMSEDRTAPPPTLDADAIRREAINQFRAEDKNRRDAIDALAGQFADSREIRQMADQAIRDGIGSDDFAKSVLAHVAKRGTAWAPEIGMTQQEVKRFSLVRAINAMLQNDWRHAGLERAASDAFAAKAQAAGIQRQHENSFFVPLEVQKRDLTVGTATAGGNMVATELRPQDFIELLRNRTLIKQLGARTLSGLVGNADITRQTAAATGYWLSTEATAITESQQTVGLLQLRPKVLGAYTEISRLLLQQATPDADQFVAADLAAVLGVALDAAAINTGGSGAPVGILGTAGIGAFTGTSLAVAALLDAQADVAGANALTTECAYLTTPAVAVLLAQRPRMTGGLETPLWQGNILDGNVLGFRAATSMQVPSATAIFGDFSQVIFAEWGVLEIAANPYANFAAGITGIRAFLTADVGVRVAGAFSAASTIT